MLSRSPIMAFLATTDADKAKRFFQDNLGLTFVTDDSFALVFDANGTTLRVAKAREFTPAPFTVLGWRVEDIAAEVRDLTDRGVAFERYPFMTDDSGYFTFPDGARVAWFKDPDGNILSLAQLV